MADFIGNAARVTWILLVVVWLVGVTGIADFQLYVVAVPSGHGDCSRAAAQGE